MKGEMEMASTDLKKEIEEVLENKKFYKFVFWYCQNPEHDVKSYDATTKSYMNGVDLSYAMSNYLNRADVQNGIKLYVKKTKDINMIKIYNVMLAKSLEGDVKSADWCSKFTQSNFFDDDADNEAHDFMKNLSINTDGSDTNG